MPIKPENMSRYAVNWREIRARILARARGRCEWCGVENGAVIHRRAAEYRDLRREPAGLVKDGWGHAVRIVLTIAHLDHQPEHNEPENLAALCQLHHNRHDAAHRRRNASATRAAKRAGGCGRLEL